MNRRELIKQIGILTGGVVVGAEVFLTGCKSGPATEVGFSEANISLLDEIGETILPATSSPGAKAVRIGQFMRTIVNDCYEEKDQRIFHDGITRLQDDFRKATNKSFMEATPQERHDFLVKLDQEAKANQKRKSDAENQKKAAEKQQATVPADSTRAGDSATAGLNNGQKEIEQKQQTDKGEKDPVKEEIPTHYFTMMKQLTLWGYFTSKEGMTQALRYVPVPGKYQGCIDYKKGDKIQVGLDG